MKEQARKLAQYEFQIFMLSNQLPLLEAGYDMLLEKPICPTKEELLTLRELGVGYGQGFFFTKPVAPFPTDDAVRPQL